MTLPTIVFVHLNSRVPLYLRLNIISTLKKFPNAKVVLIQNNKKPTRIHSRLYHFDYLPGVVSLAIENSLSHPKEFRNNFWFSAIQRFDALRSYLENTSEPVLHLESDVIVSKDFPLKIFTANSLKTAFPRVAENRGVASSIFIGDLQTAEKLVQFAKEVCEIDSRTTDMEILAQFSNKYQELTTPLPFGPNNYDGYTKEFSLGSIQPSHDLFEGIFDGNDIGVFLFGTNPRNRRGASTIRTEISGNYAQVRKWNFKFDESRKFINLEFNGEVLPIYSVHATSKQVALFYDLTQAHVMRRHLRRDKQTEYKKYYPSTALAMILRKMIKLLKRQERSH
jgi:hypothetical protein